MTQMARRQGMTEAQARVAAATFEFPPFRAKAARNPQVDGWVLSIDDGSGTVRDFLNTDDWLSTWERMPRWDREERNQ